MSFDFKAILLAYLKANGVSEAEVVTGYDETAYESGGCETCAYTQYTVDIYYKDNLSSWNIYTHDGKFGDLIKELESLDV